MRTVDLVVWCSTLACTQAAAAPQPTLRRRWNDSAAAAAKVRGDAAGGKADSPLANCKPECIAQFPAGTSYGWVRAEATATVTAATLAFLEWANGTTGTRHLPAKLPDDCTVPMTNSAGTLIAPLTVDRGVYGTMTTTLTYPTAFTDYPLSYWWSGVVPTQTAGKPVCSEAAQKQNVMFGSHPPYDSFSHGRAEDIPGEYLNGTNRSGSGYVFDSASIQLHDFYEQAFPTEMGFFSCEEFRPTLPVRIPATEIVLTTLTQTFTGIKPNVRTQVSVTDVIVAPSPLVDDGGAATPAAKPTSSLEQAKGQVDKPLAPVALPQQLGTTTPVTTSPTAPSPTYTTSTTTINIANTQIPLSIIYPPTPTLLDSNGNPASNNNNNNGAARIPQPTLIIDGQTAHPGSALIINDIPVVISSDGNDIYAGTPYEPPQLLNPSPGHPADLSTGRHVADAAAAHANAVAMPITVGDDLALVPKGAGAYVIDGQTLSAGGSAVVVGTGATKTTLSLASATGAGAGDVLAVNGVKTTLPAGVAGMSGVIGMSSAKTTSVGTGTKSAASGRRTPGLLSVWGSLGTVVISLLVGSAW